MYRRKSWVSLDRVQSSISTPQHTYNHVKFTFFSHRLVLTAVLSFLEEDFLNRDCGGEFDVEPTENFHVTHK